MLYYPKNIAPEPYFSAVLYLLYMTAVFIRNNAERIGPQQLSDLGDAIHNVPESLTEYRTGFDEQKIRVSVSTVRVTFIHGSAESLKESNRFRTSRAACNEDR